MTDAQLAASVAAIVIILALTLGAHLQWWRADSFFARLLIFIGGLTTILLLGFNRVPPKWFSGGAVGFTLALSFCAGAFIGREARWFRQPLFLGLGLPLLVFNVLAHL